MDCCCPCAARGYLYGDEIGMGDNIYLGTGMVCARQCQVERGWTAVFSAADPERLYFADDSNSVYGYQAVNVECRDGRAFAAQLDEVADQTASISGV